MTLEEYLKEVESREKAATPWDGTVSFVNDSDGCQECSIHAEEDGEIICSMNLSNENYKKDAKFISASRQDVPKLLEIIRMMRETIVNLESDCVNNSCRCIRNHPHIFWISNKPFPKHKR